MTAKKAAEIPLQVRDDFEGLCGMTIEIVYNNKKEKTKKGVKINNIA